MINLYKNVDEPNVEMKLHLLVQPKGIGPRLVFEF